MITVLAYLVAFIILAALSSRWGARPLLALLALAIGLSVFR